MHNTHPRTAKSARRKFSLTLLGALALLAVASIVVFAMPSANSFEMSASPATQTIAQGQTATYSISLNRGNSFLEPVALSVSDLPANSTAAFSRDPIPGSGSASTLTIETDGATATGLAQPKIKATSGGITRTTTVSLDVKPSNAPGFSLAGTPSSNWVTESDSAHYTILISRSGGFNGAVPMTAAGLPTGATASFTQGANTAGLDVVTNDKVHPGTYPIVVTGSALVGTTQTKRSTTVTLRVEEKKPFSIQGDAPPGLAPGAELPLNLSLKNPHNFEIYVREVAVSLDPHSDTATCDADENFAVVPMPASAFPITLPANSNLKLSELPGVTADEMPKAKMLNLSTNQDGCKGAQVYFQYSGLATK